MIAPLLLCITLFTGDPLALGQPNKPGATSDPVIEKFRRHPGLPKLRKEVAKKGWVIFSAKVDRNDWDLYVMRPDGSNLKRLTNTPMWSEFSPRYSPNGRAILYRRVRPGVKIHFERWGFQGELVIANADATNPRKLGELAQLPWGCWSADGSQLVCLAKKGIRIYDFATMKVVREMNRRGVFQQLFMSPDGKWFIGTGNTGGESWGIVRINVKSGRRSFVSVFRKCTPDWFPDSKQVIYSNRAKGQRGYGWTQLWRAQVTGRKPSLVYGEDGRHAYGGVVSPDGKYVIFTRAPKEGAGSERAGAPACLMRLADGPIIAGESKLLRKAHRRTKIKDGPVLPLSACWEPHWTYAE